jgi:hypothetical protein
MYQSIQEDYKDGGISQGTINEKWKDTNSKTIMKSPFDKHTNILDLDVFYGSRPKITKLSWRLLSCGGILYSSKLDMPTTIVKVKKANTRKTKLFREHDFTSKVGTYKEKPTFIISDFPPSKSY